MVSVPLERHLSWSQVAASFRTSWYTVYHSVEMAVTWGRAHMDLDGITAIGVDELCWGKWHRYVTVVYQINRDAVRLLWVGEKRTAKTLLRFFRWLGPSRTQQVKYVCSDMWKPYLKVIVKKAWQAIHILDRFHIVAHMNKAIDAVRASEAGIGAKRVYADPEKESVAAAQTPWKSDGATRHQTIDPVTVQS